MKYPPFWDEYVDQNVPPTVGRVVIFFCGRKRFTERSLTDPLTGSTKKPPFLVTENWLPADFKAPKVDRKVGLQNLGCQLGTVLKNPQLVLY